MLGYDCCLIDFKLYYVGIYFLIWFLFKYVFLNKEDRSRFYRISEERIIFFGFFRFINLVITKY